MDDLNKEIADYIFNEKSNGLLEFNPGFAIFLFFYGIFLVLTYPFYKLRFYIKNRSKLL